MATITHKRGDTFDIYGTVELDGVAVDISDWTINSQARDNADVVLHTFSVSKTDAEAGEYNIYAADTVTDDWTPGTYNMDIEFIDDELNVVSSDTFTLQIIADITRVE